VTGAEGTKTGVAEAEVAMTMASAEVAGAEVAEVTIR
jgi:hypothetical protein